MVGNAHSGQAGGKRSPWPQRWQIALCPLRWYVSETLQWLQARTCPQRGQATLVA